MIDQYSGPIVNIALIGLLICFNFVYFKKKFDLVWLFVNIHISTIILFFYFQSSLLKPMQYNFLALI